MNSSIHIPWRPAYPFPSSSTTFDYNAPFHTTTSRDWKISATLRIFSTMNYNISFRQKMITIKILCCVVVTCFITLIVNMILPHWRGMTSSDTFLSQFRKIRRVQYELSRGNHARPRSRRFKQLILEREIEILRDMWRRMRPICKGKIRVLYDNILAFRLSINRFSGIKALIEG